MTGTVPPVDPQGAPTRVSPNFTLSEVTKSSDAVRNGIDNSLPATMLAAVKNVAEKVLERARAHYTELLKRHVSISPSSWFRCDNLERYVCRTKIAEVEKAARDAKRDPAQAVLDYLARKKHNKGEAVDFEIPGVPNHDLAKWLSENLPEFDQIILEFYTPGIPDSGWVHVSVCLDPKRNRKQLLTVYIDKTTGKEVTLNGLHA